MIGRLRSLPGRLLAEAFGGSRRRREAGTGTPPVPGMPAADAIGTAAFDDQFPRVPGDPDAELLDTLHSPPGSTVTGWGTNAPLIKIAPPSLTRYVKYEHIPGVLGEFDYTVRARIVELRRMKDPFQNHIADFFEFLFAEVDPRAFSRIQDEQLANPGAMTKYLDPIFWFESKFRVAVRLGLDKLPPSTILDIGTGPGHFPVVARYFGHEVTGTDLPPRSGGVDETGHFYDQLCALYRVRRIPHVIRPFTPVGDVGGRYDAVTALLAAFNVHGKKLPWTIDHWKYFLRDVRDNVLNPGGQIFIVLDDKKLTRETWQFLVDASDFHDELNKQVQIADWQRLQL